MGEEYTYYDLAISMEAIGPHTVINDLSSAVTLTNSVDFFIGLHEYEI